MPRRPALTSAPVSVSLFRGAKDPHVRRFLDALDWPDLVDGLRELLAIEHAKKLSMWALTPAIFAEGHRADVNVGDHTGVVIDVDACDLDALRAACAAYRCVVYESPSSTSDEPRVRVVAAVSAPFPASAAPAVRAAFARDLGLDPDQAGVTKAAAAAQLYFIGRLAGTRARRLWSYAGAVWTPPAEALTESAPRRRAAGTGAASSPGYAPDYLPDLSALREAIEPAEEGGAYRGGRAAMRAL